MVKNKNKFYAEVKGASCRCGLTLDDIAKRLGITYQSLHRQLLNPGRMKIENVKYIRTVLDIPKEKIADFLL